MIFNESGNTEQLGQVEFEIIIELNRRGTIIDFLKFYFSMKLGTFNDSE